MPGPFTVVEFTTQKVQHISELLAAVTAYL
jgi:hypothetical protein